MWKEYKWLRFGTLLLIVGAVFFFLKYVVPLVAPLLMALIFVTIFGPLLQKLHKRFHIRRSVGSVILLVLFLSCVLLLVGYLLSFISGSIPGLVTKGEEIWTDLETMIHEKSMMIGSLLSVSGEDLEYSLLRNLEGVKTDLAGMFGNGVMAGSVRTVRSLGAGGFFLAIFVISVVMLAKDYDEIMNKLLDIRELRGVVRVFCEILRYLATLVKAQFIIIPLIGSVCSVGFLLLKVPHSIFWGTLTGLLDALPLIGPGIILFTMAILFWLRGAWFSGVCCIVLYGVCILIRQILEPRLVGKQMGIPPIVLVASIYGGIQLFGPMGILKGPLGYLMVSFTYKNLLGTGETLNLR